jgi:hypothetical protein
MASPRTRIGWLSPGTAVALALVGYRPAAVTGAPPAAVERLIGTIEWRSAPNAYTCAPVPTCACATVTCACAAAVAGVSRWPCPAGVAER